MILGVTGHRDMGKPDTKFWFEEMVDTARERIAHLEAEKVITGMARGWDLACARAAYELRVPFIAAVPHDGHGSIWGSRERARLDKALQAASEIVTVTPGPYEAWKMHKRNQWIVNHSDQILALYDGRRWGGTYACIKFARSKACPVEIIQSLS